MASRRVPVILSIVVTPLVLLGTACSSGSDNADPQPDKKASVTPFKPEDLAATNNVDPCTLATNVINDIRLHGKSADKAHLLYPVSVGAIELNGERRCEYDHGLLTLSTYVEKKNSNKLYNAVLEARTGAMSKHAIGGEIATKAAGMWITFHGQLVGGVFQPKHSGVTVVLQAPPGSIFGREQLNSVAMQATDDVINGTAEDDMS